MAIADSSKMSFTLALRLLAGWYLQEAEGALLQSFGIQLVRTLFKYVSKYAATILL